MRTLFTAAALLVLLAPVAAPAAPPTPQAAKRKAEGDLLRDRGDTKAARKAYEESLRMSPGFAEALNELGSLDFAAGDILGAIRLFEQTLAADGKFALAYFNMGFAYRKLGAFEKAVEAYRMYTSLKPSDPDGFYGLAESNREMGNRPGALAAYKEYVNRERRPSERQYVERSKKLIEEMEELEKKAAGSRGPPFIPKGGDRALSLRKITEGDQALSAKNHREALFLYQDALAADPQSPDALYRIGLAFAVLGYLPEAVERWERVAGAPAAAESLRHEARSNLERAQKMGVQVNMPARPAQVVPASGQAQDPQATARAAYEKAVQLFGQKRYVEAVDAFGAALAARPDLAYALVGRANARVALGQLDQAAADLEKALQIAPGSAAPLYSLGVVYERMGDRRKAAQAYDRYATSTAPDVDASLKTAAARKAQELR